MSKANRYSPEVRERAVRLVVEHQAGYSSQWQAICSIAGKIGCSPDSLKAWLSKAQGSSWNSRLLFHRYHQNFLDGENTD